MTLLAVAVTAARPPTPGLVAVEGRGLSLHLAAAPRSGQYLLGALQALAAGGPVLPLGARATFDDEEAAATWLWAKAERLRAALEQAKGRVELVLTLETAVPTAPTGPQASGRAWLHARADALARNRARSDDLADKARAVLFTFARPFHVSPWARPGRIGVDGSLICDSAEAYTLRAAMEARATNIAVGVSATVAGPWPPVTLATLALGDLS